MSLPVTPPYAVPTPEDHAANRAVWELDPNRAVVLVHDMQKHFLGVFSGEDGCPARAATENIRRLVDAADSTGTPVVFTAQPPNQDPGDRGLLTDFWGPGLQGGLSAEIVEPLAPAPHHTVLTKWRYNAFLWTPLAQHLASWGRDQLVITGVYAHIGCLLTATHAFMHDVQPFLVGDAVADFNREDHLMALNYAAKRCSVVHHTDHVLSCFRMPRVRVMQ